MMAGLVLAVVLITMAMVRAAKDGHLRGLRSRARESRADWQLRRRVLALHPAIVDALCVGILATTDAAELAELERQFQPPEQPGPVTP